MICTVFSCLHIFMQVNLLGCLQRAASMSMCIFVLLPVFPRGRAWPLGNIVKHGIWPTPAEKKKRQPMEFEHNPPRWLRRWCSFSIGGIWMDFDYRVWLLIGHSENHLQTFMTLHFIFRLNIPAGQTNTYMMRNIGYSSTGFRTFRGMNDLHCLLLTIHWCSFTISWIF